MGSRGWATSRIRGFERLAATYAGHAATDLSCGSGRRGSISSIELPSFELKEGVERPISGPWTLLSAKRSWSRLSTTAGASKRLAGVRTGPPRWSVRCSHARLEQEPTMREIAVLQLVADSLVNREMGQRLFLSEETVGRTCATCSRSSGPLPGPCGRRRLSPRHHRLASWPSRTGHKRNPRRGLNPRARIECFSGGEGLGYPHFPQAVENPPNEGCHVLQENSRIRRLLPAFGLPSDGGAGDEANN